MYNSIDSWKNKNVFEKQYALNYKQLADNYPPHWVYIIDIIQKYPAQKILDIGCGCGAMYKLCKKHFPLMEYTGIDYASEAIEVAKSVWNYDKFYVMDYKDLTTEFISNYELIHLGALLDVLPNGDEALDFILSLGPRSVIISRVKLTEKPSFYSTYTAYDEITTYAYYHNIYDLLDLFKKHNYSFDAVDDHFYLYKG